MRRLVMKLKFLEHYIAEAVKKTRLQPGSKISAVLAEALPDVIRELRRMATADSDIASRKFAIGMLETFWSKLLATALADNRASVNRLHAKVRAKKIAVTDRQQKLAIAAERRRIDNTLAEAKKALGR